MFRQQALLKSVRRSLAPRTTLVSSTRPVLNYDLISKPSSVPHRIKIEIAKREQQRLREAEEVLNHVEITKPETTNMYLDDAVAMYARLRKEVDKEMEKRSNISLSKKPMAVDKDLRPLSVPRKLGMENNTPSQPTAFPLATKLQTTTVPSLPSAGTTSYLHLPPASKKTDTSSKPKGEKTTTGKLPKQRSNQTSQGNGTNDETNEQLEKPRKLEKIQMRNERENGQESQDENVIDSEDGQVLKSGHERELSKDRDNIMPPLMNNFCASPRRQTRTVAFALPEHHENVHDNNTSDNDNSFQKNELVRLMNGRSHTFAALEQKREYSLGERTSSLPLLNKQRRNSDSTVSMHSEEAIAVEEGSESERAATNTRVGKRFERRSNSISELSTDSLQAIITEKIIGQLTNVQRRSSISSNQQTSLLKNYARMLQSQLKLDDIPESDSPDFSETPFMRSSTKANKSETDKDGGSLIWKSHLRYGSFRSTLTYSEIESEDNIDPKIRRRLRVTSVDAAGIVTQKEKAPKLAKLRNKYSKDSKSEDDNESKVSEEASEQDSTHV